jgi:hypothetical protein
MGIRFNCPNGHKLNVKEHLAGKRGICPDCGARVIIPTLAETGDPAGAAMLDSGPAATDSALLEIPLPEATPPLNPPKADSAVIAQPAVAVPPAAAGDRPGVEMSFSVLVAQQRRRRQLQLRIATGLLVAVILLLIVLVWVLTRNASPPADDPGGKAASLTPRQANLTAAVRRQECTFC